MDTNFDSAYIQNITSQAGRNAADSTIQRLSQSGVSESSTYEELENATKTFESYFLEQVMKSVKESLDDLNEDENEDAGMSQLTDTYMQQTLGEISEQMVNQYGGRITRDMTNQMARMYHIEIPEDKK